MKRKLLLCVVFVTFLIIVGSVSISAGGVKVTPTKTISIVVGDTTVFKINTTKKAVWSVQNQKVIKIVSKGRTSVKIKALKGSRRILVTSVVS